VLSFILHCPPVLAVARRVVRIATAVVPRPRIRRPRIGRRIAAAAVGAGAGGAAVPAAGGKACFLIPQWGSDGVLLAGIPGGGPSPALEGVGFGVPGGLPSSGDYAALVGDLGASLGNYSPVAGSLIVPGEAMVLAVASHGGGGGQTHTTVPEPASVAMFAVGLGALMIARLVRA